MNRPDLLRTIAAKTPMPEDEIEPMIDEFLSSVVSALSEGRRVEFRGFGAFFSRDYESAQRRNPKTGQTVAVASRRKVVLRASRLLLSRLRSHRPPSARRFEV